VCCDDVGSSHWSSVRAFWAAAGGCPGGCPHAMAITHTQSAREREATDAPWVSSPCVRDTTGALKADGRGRWQCRASRWENAAVGSIVVFMLGLAVYETLPVRAVCAHTCVRTCSAARADVRR
jgi:hypothetical protein